MFKIRLIKDVGSRKTVIRKGTELVVRVLPGNLLDLNRPYQVIEGEHSGLEIPLDAAVRLPAEKLYTEAEYNKLLDEGVKAAGKYTELKARFKAIKESFETMTEEKQLLQEEINQLVSGKKVALPSEVANAIERCEQQGMTRYGIVANLQNINQLFRDYPQDLLDDLRTIRQFAADKFWTNSDILMAALVNGYTIEETPQDRIKRGVQAIYEEWTTIPTSGNDQKDGADLAERITKFVTAEMKL